MTDEQIKQKAEKCARLVLMPYQTLTDEYKGRYDGFIAGAHSRDEEIKELKEEIESLQEQYNACFDGFTKRGTKLGELMKENVKLRNPWVSVDERLPEKVKGKYYSKYVFVRYKGFGCRYCVDRYCYLSKTWAFQVDGVTHWMPITELKKGIIL